MAIVDLQNGKTKKGAFPPIEVSRDTIGIGVDEGESGGRRGDRGRGDVRDLNSVGAQLDEQGGSA